MSTLVRSRTGDNRTRVEDYLDDRIQNVTDLEDIGGLLDRVKEQQELLQKQLSEAMSDLATAERTADEYNLALRKRAETFQHEQIDIDRRVKILTQSDVSDNAIGIFEERMAKLRRLEVAEGYVEILKEVQDLTSNARSTMKTDAKSALRSYARLKVISRALYAAQPAAEGAAPHLIDQVEQQASSLFVNLRQGLESSFKTTLDRMSWPKKDLKLLSSIVEDWSNQAGSLLDLQAPDLERNPLDESITSFPEPAVLLPLQVMVSPLVQRFQYHFYGERPTNRLDKPEYFFSHVLDLIEQHSPFMTQLLQPLLDERARKSPGLEAVYPDAVSAFISALLPTVSTKCLSLLPNISNQPQLLSHFMHEMMSFDNSLRDSWAYFPVPNSYIDWKGLTWEILNTHGYFNKWLEVEKEFALSRYKKIRDSVESGNIEYEGVENGRSKPTKGAVRVNDLLETITERYRGLSSFSQKMKFLMEVQLAIFDDYHSHLHGALQAYLVTSHTAGRLIQGQSDTDTGGLHGLEPLVKIFGSSEYLERKMSDWSEDLFFLELWEELQDRARRNVRSGSLGRGLTMEEVAAKTSASITKTEDVYDDEGGALFDETASSYRKLRERSEAEIVRALDTNIRRAIQPLTKISVWSSVSSTSQDIANISTSSALDSLLSTLSTLLEFLSKVIAQAALRRITRQFSQTLQREVHDNIMMRNTFSAAGALQLKRDIMAVQDVIDNSLKMPGEASRNMKKLNEALALLNLPVKASTGRATRIARETQGDEAWGFDDDEEDEEGAVDGLGKNEDGDEAAWGLWEAEKAIFASNESARGALADMRLDHLSESEARELIRRRIEINS